MQWRQEALQARAEIDRLKILLKETENALEEMKIECIIKDFEQLKETDLDLTVTTGSKADVTLQTNIRESSAALITSRERSATKNKFFENSLAPMI